MAKTIESEPEQFKHQNSALLYPNTEDHKNQAFRYLKQFTILWPLLWCLIFPCHRNLSVVSTFFLCEHLVCKARIYFRQDWLVYVMWMHVTCTDIFIKDIIKLLPTTLAHSICSAQRSNTMSSHLICMTSNLHVVLTMLKAMTWPCSPVARWVGFSYFPGFTGASPREIMGQKNTQVLEHFHLL